MKSFVWMVCAVVACAVVGSGTSEAQSQDNLSRLEAKIEALAKENASLRDRVKRIESARQVEAAPVRRAQAAASAPTVSPPTPAPQHLALSNAARVARAANYPVKAGFDPGCAAARFAGGYGGIHAGGVNYSANRTDLDGYLLFPTPVIPSSASKGWGGVVGGQIGYNWTRCNTLLGVELDSSWASANATTNFVNVTGIVAQVSSRLQSLSTARLRAGIAVDNMLFYVTGGVAAARTKTQWTSNFIGTFGPTETLTSEAWRLGWVAGFGTEWALTDRWSVRGEALYAEFGDRDYALNSPILTPLVGQPFHFKDGDSVAVARIAVNYKLWN